MWQLESDGWSLLSTTPSSLILSSPALWRPGTCNGQLRKPKPSLQPSLLRAAQWGPVPWLEPLPQINQADICACGWAHTHTHRRIGILKCTLCPRRPLFIPAGSHSQIPGLAIRCPWLFVGSFMPEHKDRFSLCVSSTLLIHLHPPHRL